ncbi:MAG: glycosyltransferase [Actinomycetales bacterium]|nr:glycosyltransferase [Actinomycetales bacterium]
MRILHLSWEYPPVVYGGLGRHVHALAEAQAALGHDVAVVTQAGEGAAAEEVVHGVRILRVAPVAPAPEDWRDGFLEWCFGFNTAVTTAAIPFARDWRPDVLHVHDWLVAQGSIMLRSALGLPVVLTVHATESGRTGGVLGTALSRGVDAIEGWVVGEADEVIVCSEYMRHEVVGLFDCDPEVLTVIPNGIDPREWSTTPSRKRAMRHRFGSPLIGFTGRLESEKGVQTLIDAMPVIRRSVPDARAVIVGTGGAEAELRNRVRRRRLSDAVHFAGYVSDEDLRAIVAASDVQVVPSLYEPFGFVALEAMVMGTPLVAARTGGLAGIVEDGVTGRLFAPGDAGDLAEAVVDMLAHPSHARRCLTAARRAAEEQYGWAAIAASTDAVYARALGDDDRGAG